MYLGNVRNLSWSFQVGLNALLALVEEPELSPLVGVDDSKDLGDSLADVMNAGELGVLEPPVTLAVLSWINSLYIRQHSVFPASVPCSATYDLRSVSWDASSSLDLFHSWAVFCGGCEHEIGQWCLRERGCTYDLGSRLEASSQHMFSQS